MKSEVTASLQELCTNLSLRFRLVGSAVIILTHWFLMRSLKWVFKKDLLSQMTFVAITRSHGLYWINWRLTVQNDCTRSSSTGAFRLTCGLQLNIGSQNKSASHQQLICLSVSSITIKNISSGRFLQIYRSRRQISVVHSGRLLPCLQKQKCAHTHTHFNTMIFAGDIYCNLSVLFVRRTFFLEMKQTFVFSVACWLQGGTKCCCWCLFNGLTTATLSEWTVNVQSEATNVYVASFDTFVCDDRSSLVCGWAAVGSEWDLLHVSAKRRLAICSAVNSGMTLTDQVKWNSHYVTTLRRKRDVCCQQNWMCSAGELSSVTHLSLRLCWKEKLVF